MRRKTKQKEERCGLGYHTEIELFLFGSVAVYKGKVLIGEDLYLRQINYDTIFEVAFYHV